MPAPLDEPTDRVTFRGFREDMALLRTAHPRKVNAVLRLLVREYANTLRAGAPSLPVEEGEGTDVDLDGEGG